MPTGKWEVIGYDTFDEGFYSLLDDNIFETEDEAKEAAQRRLENLEKTQPSEDFGGQGDEEIQDHVFIVRPDGSRYRYLPVA